MSHGEEWDVRWSEYFVLSRCNSSSQLMTSAFSSKSSGALGGASVLHWVGAGRRTPSTVNRPKRKLIGCSIAASVI